ncbi:MAG: (d)CMP kinase [Cyclobacteriaceae bacterium]
MPNDIVIAIDGYSGCGKSSTAKAVAHALDYTYIDSGAMYRAVTLYLLRDKISFSDIEAVVAALEQMQITFKMKMEAELPLYETYLNGENVEREIRSMDISDSVSEVSAIPQVRQAMVGLQRNMGANKRVVMDGRDIGTNVFPNAEVKVFMTADLYVRASRRQKELKERGVSVAVSEIVENLAERDQIDSTRKENPLVKAEDAVVIDTTDLEFNKQVQRVVDIAREAMQAP